MWSVTIVIFTVCIKFGHEMNYIGLKEETHSSSEDFQFTLAQQKQQRRTAMKWSEQFYKLRQKRQIISAVILYIFTLHTSTKLAPVVQTPAMQLSWPYDLFVHWLWYVRCTLSPIYMNGILKASHTVGTMCPAIGPFLSQYCRFLWKVFLILCSLYGGILADAVCSVN